MNRNKTLIRRHKTGTIGPSSKTADILWLILKERCAEVRVLRIASSDHTVCGDIAINLGTYVIGAELNGRREKGYEALKTLLRIQSGTYQYLSYCGTQPAQLDQGFRIRISELIAALPMLPATLRQIESGRLDVTGSHSPIRHTADKIPITENNNVLPGGNNSKDSSGNRSINCSGDGRIDSSTNSGIGNRTSSQSTTPMAGGTINGISFAPPAFWG